MFRVKVLPRAESQLVKIQKNIQIKIVAFIDNLEVTYYPNKYDISSWKGVGTLIVLGLVIIEYFILWTLKIKRLLFFIFV